MAGADDFESQSRCCDGGIADDRFGRNRLSHPRIVVSASLCERNVLRATSADDVDGPDVLFEEDPCMTNECDGDGEAIVVSVSVLVLVFVFVIVIGLEPLLVVVVVANTENGQEPAVCVCCVELSRLLLLLVCWFVRLLCAFVSRFVPEFALSSQKRNEKRQDDCDSPRKRQQDDKLPVFDDSP